MTYLKKQKKTACVQSFQFFVIDPVPFTPFVLVHFLFFVFFFLFFLVNIELGFLNGNALINAGLLCCGGTFLLVQGKAVPCFLEWCLATFSRSLERQLLICSRKMNHLKKIWVWKTLPCVTSSNVYCIYCFNTVLVTSLFWYRGYVCECIFIVNFNFGSYLKSMLKCLVLSSFC